MYIAKKYFVLGRKFYQPGDWVQQEDINEAQWRNLADAGAIETHVDEVAATLDEGSSLGVAAEDALATSAEGDAFADMALPDVAVVEYVPVAEKSPAGKKSQKGTRK